MLTFGTFALPRWMHLRRGTLLNAVSLTIPGELPPLNKETAVCGAVGSLGRKSKTIHLCKIMYHRCCEQWQTEADASSLIKYFMNLSSKEKLCADTSGHSWTLAWSSPCIALFLFCHCKYCKYCPQVLDFSACLSILDVLQFHAQFVKAYQKTAQYSVLRLLYANQAIGLWLTVPLTKSWIAFISSWHCQILEKQLWSWHAPKQQCDQNIETLYHKCNAHRVYHMNTKEKSRNFGDLAEKMIAHPEFEPTVWWLKYNRVIQIQIQIQS